MSDEQEPQPWVSGEAIERHAEKQGVSYADAWSYFRDQGYNMDGYDHYEFDRTTPGEEIEQAPTPPPADIEDTDSRWKQAADQALADGGPVHPTPEGRLLAIQGGPTDAGEPFPPVFRPTDLVFDEDAYLRDRERNAEMTRGLHPKDIRGPLARVDMTARGADPIAFYFADEAGRIAPVKMPEPGEKVRIITGKPTGALDEETGLRAYQAGDQVQISEPIPVVNRVRPKPTFPTPLFDGFNVHPETARFLLLRSNGSAHATPVFQAAVLDFMTVERRESAWDIEDTHPFHD